MGVVVLCITSGRFGFERNITFQKCQERSEILVCGTVVGKQYGDTANILFTNK